MSSKQRKKNRVTYSKLLEAVREKRNASHVCENCGGKGGHWIQTKGPSLNAMITGIDDQEGYWTCERPLT